MNRPLNYQINVISCKNLEERIWSIKNTWGRNRNNVIFYADFHDEKNNIIKCTDIPTHDGCEQKTIQRFKQIKNNNLHDWYFFVDDDTYVNIPNLEKMITELSPDYYYGVSCNNWPSDKTLIYPAGGAGFFISSKSFEMMSIIPSHFSIPIHFGDVTAGLILRANNIPFISKGIIEWVAPYNLIKNPDRLYFNDEVIHNLTKKELNEVVTLHKVSGRMESLHNYFLNNEN
jgi:hypothetical protein